MSAVYLYPEVAHLAIRVARVRLRHRNGQGSLFRVVAHYPRGVINRGPRALGHQAACSRNGAARPGTGRWACRTACASWRIRPMRPSPTCIPPTISAASASVATLMACSRACRAASPLTSSSACDIIKRTSHRPARSVYSRASAFTPSPCAFLSTTTTARSDPIRAATIMQSATSASLTKSFFPLSLTASAVSVGAQSHARRGPTARSVRAGPRWLSRCLPRSPQEFLSLLARARCSNERARKRSSRKESARHERAAHLFKRYGHLDHAKPKPSVLFREDQAGPPLLDELFPEVLRIRLALFDHLAHKLRRALQLRTTRGPNDLNSF